MSFGERVKKLRIERGYTQEALADAVGVKKQTISRYENSDREPNIRSAKALADALGVPLELLVHGEISSRSLSNKEKLNELIDQMTRDELIEAIQTISKKL